MTERFFDAYPKFYETTGTLLLPNRFQQRWKMIIGQHSHILKGARVLDLASHDGRWAFAALKAGASYVEGVEGRAEFVDSANQTFASYQIENERYSFHQGDVVDYLSKPTLGHFDVILNLGFFYHTLKHLQILEGMAGTGAPVFIIDTGISQLTASIIELSLDTVADRRHAIDHAGMNRETVPVGTVSRSALAMMLDSVGYDCQEADWHAAVTDFADCPDYLNRARGTFIARKVDPRL